MPNPKDRRSRLRKWIDRASLTMDSGVVVLCILAIATASMLVIRHFRNSPISAQYAAAVVPKRDDISGVPRVIDGDTLDIGGIRVRLFGIDVPEHGQICRDELSPFAVLREMISEGNSFRQAGLLPLNGIRAIILATKIWLIISGLVFGVAVLSVPRNIERISALRAK